MIPMISITKEQYAALCRTVNDKWDDFDVWDFSDLWDSLSLTQHVLGDQVPELRKMKVVEGEEYRCFRIMAEVATGFWVSTGPIAIDDIRENGWTSAGGVVVSVLAHLITYRNGLMAQMREHGRA